VERQRHALAVQITNKIQQMSLDRELVLAERRAHAHVDDGPISGGGHADLAEVDTARQPQRTLGLDVGRGESQGSSAAGAAHHLAANRVGRPRSLAAAGRSPRWSAPRISDDETATPSIMNAGTMFASKPSVPARLSSNRASPRAARPNRMIEPHDDLARAERFDQDALDEGLGLDGCDRPRERDHHGRLDPGLGDQLEPLFQRGDRQRRLLR